MTIQKKMEDILKLAKRLTSSENQVDAFNSFVQRTSELKEFQDDLSDLRDVKLNFKQNLPGLSLTFPHEEDAKNLYNNAVQIREQINRDPNPNGITQNRIWRALTENLPKLSLKMKKDLFQEWNEHLKSTVQIKDPEEFIGLSGTSNDNNKIFKKYKDTHDKYKNKAENPEKLPKSKVEIVEIKLIADELQKLSKRFASDLSDDIIRFLKRSGEIDGAELRYLTTEVLQFLMKQSDYQKYRIKIPPHLR